MGSIQIYDWTGADEIADYSGKSSADEEKICWHDSLMGVPLVSLVDWDPPILEQYLGGITKKRKPIGDSPASGPVNIISQRAADALSDIWDQHALLYPVILDDDRNNKYYMVVVQTVLDCLDREKSTGTKQKYSSTPNLFASIHTWSFFNDCIGDTDLFVLPDSNVTSYVSERFKQRVIKAGLKGFCLKKEFWEENSWVS